MNHEIIRFEDSVSSLSPNRACYVFPEMFIYRKAAMGGCTLEQRNHMESGSWHSPFSSSRFPFCDALKLIVCLRERGDGAFFHGWGDRLSCLSSQKIVERWKNGIPSVKEITIFNVAFVLGCHYHFLAWKRGGQSLALGWYSSPQPPLQAAPGLGIAGNGH